MNRMLAIGLLGAMGAAMAGDKVDRPTIVIRPAPPSWSSNEPLKCPRCEYPQRLSGKYCKKCKKRLMAK